jgi:hypothetical protein
VTGLREAGLPLASESVGTTLPDMLTRQLIGALVLAEPAP